MWEANFGDFSADEQRAILMDAHQTAERFSELTDPTQIRAASHQLLSVVGMLGYTEASALFRSIEQRPQLTRTETLRFNHTVSQCLHHLNQWMSNMQSAERVGLSADESIAGE